MAERPGKCGLSHYATAILDGMIYMSGYPSGVLYGLDPARPWTANQSFIATRIIRETDADSNPRRLAYWKSSGVNPDPYSPPRIHPGGGMDVVECAFTRYFETKVLAKRPYLTKEI